ncbi:hypothetical protein [Arthrobacter sp. Soil764]|uniref:hypothetical protein n=1 Tax=Arthrobacter sp. Soil764 TaxID=1736403 RepID=UPI0006FEACAF|nr:hypothetical protein [Arthrobacter sp. Soil764]KRE91366.1 hypothetical protein ASG86_14430 [Arthrobacter sp. Soil764]
MHPEAGKSVRKLLPASRVGRALMLAAGALILTSCGAGQSGGAASNSGSSTTTAASSTASPSAEATATPPKVFTDQELMAISSKVLEPHGGRAEDTAMARKSYVLMTQPPTSASASSILGPTEPGECNVFHRSWQHEAQLDPSMGFALAEIFNVGAHGTGMILFDVRSAPRETLARADFDYSPELMVRCATFDQTVSGATGPQKMTIQLLPGPDIGEKAYVTKESISGNTAGVGLRVLAGTVSLDMGANTGLAITEEEALNLMSQIAQQFVDEVKSSH